MGVSGARATGVTDMKFFVNMRSSQPDFEIDRRGREGIAVMT